MRKIIIIYIILLSCLLLAQENSTIENLEKAYKNMTLKGDSMLLEVNSSDANPVKAAKGYYQAMLHKDIQQSIILHSLNFATYQVEFYGQLSGLQLISTDYINREYEKALLKIELINSETIPEVLYWKAKIYQLSQRYDEAIAISENFVSKHQDNHMYLNVWLIIFESYFYKKDLSSFEKQLASFSQNPEFNEYKPYLLYLNAMLYEDYNTSRARAIYNQIITDHPTTQFRVQAEDRLYALRTTNTDKTVSTPVTNTSTFRNIVVSQYEELRKNEFYIQFGVFSRVNAAMDFVSALDKDKIPAFYISKPVGENRLYAVIQGPFPTINHAKSTQNEIDSKKYQTFIFKAE